MVNGEVFYKLLNNKENAKLSVLRLHMSMFDTLEITNDYILRNEPSSSIITTSNVFL